LNFFSFLSLDVITSSDSFTIFFTGTRQALAFLVYMNAMSRREISTITTSTTKQGTSDKPRRYILMPAKTSPTPLSQSTTEKEKLR